MNCVHTMCTPADHHLMIGKGPRFVVRRLATAGSPAETQSGDIFSAWSVLLVDLCVE